MPAEGGERSFIKVEKYHQAHNTLEDDELDGDDLDESQHNANSINETSLHGKQYKAPSMRGSFLNTTQKLDVAVFKAAPPGVSRNQSFMAVDQN